jgi:hypothetical protein
MTEQEWLEGRDLQGMLLALRGKASERKMWLFACACCRLTWHVLPERCHRLVEAVERYADKEAERGELTALQLLLDIFDNLFRRFTVHPAWLSWHGGLPVSMASRMYDCRDFADMPVLADALEEAGCRDQDILSHCRSGGERVRGCWVVDLLLGKT